MILEIDGPEDFALAFDVSRETMDKLRIYDSLLLRWNERINLIGPSTLRQRWSRHFADSAQLISHAPEGARSWVDMGAGAGFPGLVIAALASESHVSLIESDTRKVVFLQTVAREMGVSASIYANRIDVTPVAQSDIVTSRALAPLTQLLGYAARFTGPLTTCLFHKGANLESELTEALRHWHIQYRRHPSLTDPAGEILEIQEFGPLHDS